MENNVNPEPLDNLETIDLDNHAVIEASAGTGKTHTIEFIVIELLKTGMVSSLDEILVVTFTEKATGELKNRIREKLIGLLDKRENPVFRRSLDNFDTASIFTIHGFCSKILKQFAFENGEQFNLNIIEDERFIQQTELHSIMREVWPDTFGKELDEVLKLSQFPQVSPGQDTGGWEEQALLILKIYQSGGNNQLKPEPVEDLHRFIHDIREKQDSILGKISSVAGGIDRDNLPNSDLFCGYGSLNIAKRSREKRQRDIILPLLAILSRFNDSTLQIADMYPLMDAVKNEAEGFGVLDTGWNKGGPDYSEKLPCLPDVIHYLEELRMLDYRRLQVQLLSNTVGLLQERVNRNKKRHSLVSYDDMIRLVSDSLVSEDSLLRERLQHKYKYALVDEFQDTDFLQWRIFKNIFLSGGYNRLFIIGDPKQAIYNFRGADVNVYHSAKMDMISGYGANFYTLRNNWRSSAHLIHIFNTLFSGRNWFTDEHITYTDNRFPHASDRADSPFDENPFIIVDNGTCSGTEARYLMADYIADEIVALLKRERSMALNEIGILFRKWVEVEPLEQALISRGIPFTYYKREGLYQTREALSLWYLLKALVDGSIESYRKALLTGFFNFSMQDLHNFESLSEISGIEDLFASWREYASSKEWGVLFQSILEDTEFLNCGMDDSMFYRRRMNMYQIVQNLQIEAYSKNMSLEQIVVMLEGLYNQDNRTGTITDLHKPESEEERVTLLTIHASKGLQFRIVFVAGGYTFDKPQKFWVYHDSQQRLIDLTRDESYSDRYALEKEYEDERLFYVAVTRARDRVYVPCFVKNNSRKSGFIAEKLPVALSAVEGSRGVHRVSVHGRQAVEDIFQPVREDFKDYYIPEPVFISDELNFLSRKVYMDSFTGLKRKQSLNETDADNLTFGDETITDYIGEDIEPRGSTVQSYPGTEKAVLPPGTNTGLMLHEILEEIEFDGLHSFKDHQQVVEMDNPVRSVIAEKIRMYMPYLDKETEMIFLIETSRLIWNCLSIPVPETGLPIGRSQHYIREMEFFFDTGHMLDDIHVPGMKPSKGIIHGFIDLIFKHDNRYYICDWKSNILDRGYDRHELEEDIRMRNYDLQYQIYSLALVKWLRSVHGDYNHDKLFGGVIYVYLRGLDPLKPGNGMFFQKLSMQDIIQFEEEIYTLISL